MNLKDLVRRQMNAIGWVVWFTVLSVPLERACVGGEDWPTFLGPRGDSTSAETGIFTGDGRSDWQQSPPRVVWTLGLGESYGTCTISGDRCFQFDRIDGEARLRCLDRMTGRQIWSYKYPSAYRDAYGYNDGPRCSPIADGERVYVYGVEGELHCVEAADGKPLWHVDTAERYGVVQNFFGVGSNPVLFNDLVIAMVGGSTPETESVSTAELDQVVGDRSAIVAFDKRTGAERYRVSDELASYASLRLADVSGRPWLFAFVRGGLLGLDPANGNQRFFFPWRAKILESVNASVPVVEGDEVFISETYGPGSALLKVRPDGYDVVWKDDPRQRRRSLQTHWNTAIHVDGYVYGSSGRHSNSAELRCVEWRTGKIMWSQPGLLRSSLLYVDGHFIVLSENGVLSVVKANPKEFELVTYVKLNQPLEHLEAAVSSSQPLANGQGAPAGEQNPPPSPDEPKQNGQASSEGTPGTSRPLVAYPAWAAPILSHGLLYVRGKDRLVCLALVTGKRS